MSKNRSYIKPRRKKEQFNTKRSESQIEIFVRKKALRCISCGKFAKKKDLHLGTCEKCIIKYEKSKLI